MNASGRKDVHTKHGLGSSGVVVSCPVGGALRDTAPAWHFGARRGLQVWVARGDPRVWASLMLDPRCRSAPIVLLNRRIVGSEDEGRALAWALARVAEGAAGFYVLAAD